MAIHIICPPGHYGGIISGRLDSKIGILPEEIAIYQKIGKEWTARRLGVTAARLWSCDLGYDPSRKVDVWMAAVVSQGFSPNREPKAGDRVFQVTQEFASSLSVHLVERDGQHLLEGTVWPVSPPQPESLFRLVWCRSEPLEEDEPSFGWHLLDAEDPMGYEPIADEPATFSTSVAPAPQFAVIQVKGSFANHFIDHPEDNELPRVDGAESLLRDIRRKKLHILPTRHAFATAFTACIDVKLLSHTGSALSGVITGLGCAYDHAPTLTRDAVPEERQFLRVWAWAIDAGRRTPIGTVLCAPSGYWVFDDMPDDARNAASFAIAVSTQQVKLPLDTLPVHGGEVVAFRVFKWDAASGAFTTE